MGTIADLTELTAADTADLMLIRDVSEASNKDKRITWTNVRATLKTYFDTLYADLSSAQTVTGVKNFTNGILASIINMDSALYQRYASVAVASGETWTINITMASARNLAIVEIDLTIGTNAANTWGALARKVTFRTDATVGNNAVILTNVDLGTGSGSNITLTGPTAIPDGIRFTAAAAASTTTSHNHALIKVVGRQSNLAISSSVA